MDRCPKCQSQRVHRSRTRSWIERFRRTFTGKAPFRCSQCGWRGWAFDFGPSSGAAAQPVAHDVEPDLHAIDDGLSVEGQQDKMTTE